LRIPVEGDHWSLAAELGDETLERRLYPPVERCRRQSGRRRMPQAAAGQRQVAQRQRAAYRSRAGAAEVGEGPPAESTVGERSPAAEAQAEARLLRVFPALLDRH